MLKHTQQAIIKASNASIAQCDYAIKDCHETLRIGQYDYDSDYAQKLWAEIDAYRDRKHHLLKM